jgi:glycosyltransferase involved in cell wall biosynthesis
MIIWFAANVASGSSGGIARSIQGLSEGLSKLGHRTVVIKHCARGGYIGFALKLGARLIVNVAHRPDWIVARSTDGVLCALLIKVFSLKTRLAIHNHGWEEYVYELEKRLPGSIAVPRTTWKARLVRFPLLRANLKLCTCCISGALCETRWLKKKYSDVRHKLRYIPNGVDMISPGFWIERHDTPPNLLAIGGFTWKKNLNHTVAVFENLSRSIPECRLYAIGSGIEKERLPNPLHPGIIVVPEVNPDEMSAWYKTCPFLISSSRYEGGHSFVLLEALSYACIVFASSIPSSREIIRNGENGLLISGTDARLDAKAIAEALIAKNNCLMIRRRAFSTALRNRWDRQVNRMERILCLSR